MVHPTRRVGPSGPWPTLTTEKNRPVGSAHCTRRAAGRAAGFTQQLKVAGLEPRRGLCPHARTVTSLAQLSLRLARLSRRESPVGRAPTESGWPQPEECALRNLHLRYLMCFSVQSRSPTLQIPDVALSTCVLTFIGEPNEEQQSEANCVQWVTKVMTPASMRNTWKRESRLLWPTVPKGHTVKTKHPRECYTLCVKLKRGCSTYFG